MEYKIISSEGNGRLVLFFAGWGMDASPFASLRRPGYDIAVLYDYTTPTIDWSFTAPYREIFIVAWSFGVYASAISTHAIDRKVTGRIAVNGTLYPCHRRLGIPPAIFDGTLAGLSQRNMARFYRRVCGTAEAFAAFGAALPDRTVDSLRLELEAFSPDATLLHDPIRHYDLAIISRNDAIIPAANQWRAWLSTPTIFVDGHHMIDFQKVLDHFVLDKQRVEHRFATGLRTYDSEASVQSGVVSRIEALVHTHGIDAAMSRTGYRALEIGSGTGSLSQLLDDLLSRGYLEMWDLAGKPCLDGNLRSFRNVDAEIEIAYVPSQSFEMIATASTVQWFNSPARFLRQCLRVLAPGGYLILSSFLAGNLASVSDATGRRLPLMTMRQWLQELPRGFELVDAAAWNVNMDFDSAIDVFRHLKATGVNALGRNSQGESDLRRILRRYPAALDGRYHITYRPFIFILRKRP